MTMKLLKILSCVALIAVLPACTRGVTSTPGDAPNLEAWVAEVRARPAPPLEPLPVMQQFETFEYAAQVMRDPFSDAWVSAEGGNGTRRIRTGARSRWKPSRSMPSTWWGPLEVARA